MPYLYNPSLVDDPENEGDLAHIDSEKMKIQRLFLWLEEQGASLSSVKVEVGQGGREIRAKREIKADSLVMHIPKSLFITTEAAKESEIGQLIASSSCDIGDSGYMAAHLIEMKRQGSFWDPYIDVLPNGFLEHPYFLTESELEYLKGSYALRVIHSRRKQIDNEYNQLVARLPKEKIFSREEYFWGCCVYLTRTHTMRLLGIKTHSLVPLADMPNHSISPNVLWGFESSRGFLYSAARNIEIDEPLTIRYWRECNGMTLARYGFCLENNPYNVAEIQLPSLPPDHPGFEYAKGMGVIRGDKRVFWVPRDYEAIDSRALFSYLRLSTLTDLTGITISEDCSGEVPQIGLLSHEQEILAMEALAKACQSALQKFDTSIVEDETFLKDSGMPLKLRNLIQVRHGEKSILKYFLDRAEVAHALPHDYQHYPCLGEPENKALPASLSPVSRAEGWIIVLNGGACAGASALAKAILELEEVPALHLSLEPFDRALSSQYAAHKWQLHRELDSLVAAARAASLDGMNVVIDTVLTSHGQWGEIRDLLSGARTYWIGVHAPLPQLLAHKRRHGRGREAYVTVHEGIRYDIDVLTETTPPLALARFILDCISHAETAREDSHHA